MLSTMIHECTPRVSARGWQAKIIVAIGIISILGFLAFTSRLESERSNDGIRVADQPQYVYDPNSTTNGDVPPPYRLSTFSSAKES